MSEKVASKRRYTWYIGIPLLIVLAVIVSGLIFRGEYTTEQTVRREFTIDMEFTKLRKIMVRTNASKEIVTMGGDSEFVSQKWTEAEIDTSGENFGQVLLNTVLSGSPEWGIDLKGTLQVRTLDEYIGKNVIDLAQEVQVRPDMIESQAKLVKGSEKLVGYELLTRFSRDEDENGKDQSKVELELTQAIKTDAPWFAHSIADRRVRRSAARALENQERATRQLIEENADKAGVFPLR